MVVSLQWNHETQSGVRPDPRGFSGDSSCRPARMKISKIAPTFLWSWNSMGPSQSLFGETECCKNKMVASKLGNVCHCPETFSMMVASKLGNVCHCPETVSMAKVACFLYTGNTMQLV